jgi:hypothetical protein
MPGPRLEAAVSSLAAQARLYERVAHDRGPWGAIVHDDCLAYPVALARHEHGDHIVLVGYLSVAAAGIMAIDLWCRGRMLYSLPVDPPRDGPSRIVFDLGITNAEWAA